MLLLIETRKHCPSRRRSNQAVSQLLRTWPKDQLPGDPDRNNRRQQSAFIKGVRTINLSLRCIRSGNVDLELK